jgi:predicted phage-related endonuclease
MPVIFGELEDYGPIVGPVQLLAAPDASQWQTRTYSQSDPMQMSHAEFLHWLRNTPDERGYVRAIGSTDIGAILGIDGYKRPIDVWRRLLNQPGSQSFGSLDVNLERGRMLEPVVVQMYEADSGRAVLTVEGPSYAQPYPVPPFGEVAVLRASPDRWIDSQSEYTGRGVLEVKTMNQRVFSDFLANGMPPHYYAQVQWHMAVTGARWASWAVLCMDPWRFEWFDVPRDDQFIAIEVEAAQAFWEQHVMIRRPPARDEPITDVPIVTPPLGRQVVVTSASDWRRIMEDLKYEKECFDDIKRSYEATKERAKRMIEAVGHDTVVVRGAGKMTWKESTSTKFNRQRLRDARPLDRELLRERMLDGGFLTNEVNVLLDDSCLLDLEQFVERTTTRAFCTYFNPNVQGPIEVEEEQTVVVQPAVVED